MNKLILAFAATLFIGCTSTPSSDADPSHSTKSYRETNPDATAGVDTAIWSSNPKKTTVIERIEQEDKN